jgi:hypothetical protein
MTSSTSFDTAIRYYEAEGWRVADVGAVESFDLRCERDGQEVHVEVKGTTGNGERIILTPNEVAHARVGDTELFIVIGIELALSAYRPHPKNPTGSTPSASRDASRSGRDAWRSLGEPRTVRSPGGPFKVKWSTVRGRRSRSVGGCCRRDSNSC